jgi:HD-GYP domain-containing protein (c-di-GMP phosphodiesterase class II)
MSVPTKKVSLDSLDEEYYQVNPEILTSFPKFRPPLNIFHFREDVARLVQFFKVGDRLSNEQVDEMNTLAEEGLIFVSRSDHHVYVKHISYQLDLVLVDKNLKESEIADIFVQALTMRLDNFFEQPIRAVFDKLKTDILVLTEYVWPDPFRLRALVKRLHPDHSLAKHSCNCGILGLALYCRAMADNIKKGEIKRQTLDNMAIGLFIHDLGMTKIPLFIRNKDKPVTPDERQKLNQHPTLGSEMLFKLDLRVPEIEGCVLQHHERLNGSGYPLKAKDKELSLAGRLCGLADSFAAMTVDRPNAQAVSPAQAVTELLRDESRYDAKLSLHLQAMILTGK